jgi:2-polyprenyl-3-methyl-5-hydroxy-6-metoxy-1,4-benzoquinol methylase
MEKHPMDQALTFDRVDDVSKFDGCNTRGLEYRWDIFKRHLTRFQAGSAALDFGAGSLRESFDLITRGYHVTSVDLDRDTLDTYKAKYNWPAEPIHELIAGQDFSEAISRLGDRKFSIVTCFDVLEHLEDPVSVLKEISKHLNDDTRLFVTVPNGRTLFELAWRIDLIIAKRTGRYMRPGEPHLQCNSTAKWKAIFREANLSIVDHEMQIGFFANTAAALFQVPLSLSGRILRKLGINVDALSLSERIIAKIAPSMDMLDRYTRFLKGLYGWNLFVLAKAVR